MRLQAALKVMYGSVYCLMLCAAILPGAVYADMRCKSGLVSEGDLTEEVKSKCGEPKSRKLIPAAPASMHNGERRQGANIEYWRYGPRNGAYYELKFIDARLVSIKYSR